MTDEERIQAARQRYEAAAHAVQTGAGVEIDLGSHASSPKHLRTGIDTAKADQGALAALLIAKGVFTEVEYAEAMAEGAEREKARYEAHIAKTYGFEVTLG